MKTKNKQGAYMEFRTNYWDDTESKTAFIDFLVRIHGLDLTEWGEKGFWDEDYRPFSFFENGKVVSNVCLYSMDMTVKGRRTRVAQISGVGTVPEFRSRGLGGELTKRAMEWADPRHDFYFLFSDKDAIPFYRKRGFKSTDEYKVISEAEGANPLSGMHKIDMEIDKNLDLLYDIASNRSPVSHELGVHMPKLLMFWILKSLKDHVSYIPDLELAVVFRRKGGILTVLDVIGKYIPELKDFYPFMRKEGDSTIEFRFMTDKMGLSGKNIIEPFNNGTHYFGDFPHKDMLFTFPFTAMA